MNLFLLNIILALLWAAVTGDISLFSLGTGFVVGFIVLAIVGRALGDTRYLGKLGKGIALGLFFVWELIVSSVRVAWDVVTPLPGMRPAIIAVPLDVTSDAEITLLANLISLTPGTLSLDVSEDRKTLFVHGMHVDDPDALRASIKEDFERRVKDFLA